MRQSEENGIVSEATGPPRGIGSCEVRIGLEKGDMSSDDTEEAAQVSPHTSDCMDAVVPLSSWGQQARGLAAQATRDVTSTIAIAHLYTSTLVAPIIKVHASY
jgi:hypothetical protein